MKKKNKLNQKIFHLYNFFKLTTLIEKMGVHQVLKVLPFGNACCSLDLIATFGPKKCNDIFNISLANDIYSENESDLLIISGFLTPKVLPEIFNIYKKMIRPTKVMALGACASSGGLYENTDMLKELFKNIPVDVFVPGCPPHPSAIIQALDYLQNKS